MDECRFCGAGVDVIAVRDGLIWYRCQECETVFTVKARDAAELEEAMGAVLAGRQARWVAE